MAIQKEVFGSFYGIGTAQAKEIVDIKKSVLLNEDTVCRLIILGSKSFHLVTQKGKKVL